MADGHGHDLATAIVTTGREIVGVGERFDARLAAVESMLDRMVAAVDRIEGSAATARLAAREAADNTARLANAAARTPVTAPAARPRTWLWPALVGLFVMAAGIAIGIAIRGAMEAR